MRLSTCFLSIALMLSLQISVFANVVPVSADDIPCNSIGLYQTDKRIVVYEKPSSTSRVVLDKQLNYLEYVNLKLDSMFAVLIPNKSLGYLYVIDADEDWVQVLYDKDRNLKGWVYKNDEFQFLPWINFYNMYGRKYGLKQLKNVPLGKNDVRSQPNESAQLLGKMNRPKQIRVTSIEGNWVLVTVLDVTSNICTGYIQWRDINGQFYLFPSMK